MPKCVFVSNPEAILMNDCERDIDHTHKNHIARRCGAQATAERMLPKRLMINIQRHLQNFPDPMQQKTQSKIQQKNAHIPVHGTVGSATQFSVGGGPFSGQVLEYLQASSVIDFHSSVAAVSEAL